MLLPFFFFLNKDLVLSSARILISIFQNRRRNKDWENWWNRKKRGRNVAMNINRNTIGLNQIRGRRRRVNRGAGRRRSSSTPFDFNIYDVLSGPFHCRGSGGARLHSSGHKRSRNERDQRGERGRERRRAKRGRDNREEDEPLEKGGRRGRKCMVPVHL